MTMNIQAKNNQMMLTDALRNAPSGQTSPVNGIGELAIGGFGGGNPRAGRMGMGGSASATNGNNATTEGMNPGEGTIKYLQK